MSFYTVNVLAGVQYVAPYAGKFFALDNAGTARQVDVQLSYQGQDDNIMPGRVQGFQCPAQFDKIYFYSAVNTTVQFFATQAPVQLGIKDGTAVNVPSGVAITNTSAQSIPVSIATPVTLNATSVEINNTIGQEIPVALDPAASVKINNTAAQSIPVTIQNTNAQPLITQRQTITTIVDLPAATVGTATAALISNGALIRLRIRASSANTGSVYIGGAGVTAVNAAIVLQPGDTWIEDDLACAAWFACADIAASVVTLQGAH